MSAESDGTPKGRRPSGGPATKPSNRNVLRAAVELLHEKPVEKDLTLAELVKRSGTSRAAIYRRWADRQAVVVAALDADRRPMAKVENAL